MASSVASRIDAGNTGGVQIAQATTGTSITNANYGTGASGNIPPAQVAGIMVIRLADLMQIALGATLALKNGHDRQKQDSKYG